MKRTLLVLGFALAGCGAQPRDRTYCEAHPEATAQALAACTRGANRSRECDNAREGRAAVERKARMELYGRSF